MILVYQLILGFKLLKLMWMFHFSFCQLFILLQEATSSNYIRNVFTKLYEDPTHFQQ